LGAEFKGVAAMTWYIWCEIVCDKCSVTTAGRFNSKSLNKKEMCSDAIKNGWKLKNDEWFCNLCKKDLTAQNSRI